MAAGSFEQYCILLRHGTPVPEDEDALQPLSEKGRQEAEFTANGITQYLKGEISNGNRNITIVHSGKLRAQQTAEVVADALKSASWEATCREQDGLKPKDEPAGACEFVKSVDGQVIVIVGHLPHMGRFAASLLDSPASAGRLGGLFNPASGVVLRREDGTWKEAAEIIVGCSWWMEAPPPPMPGS
eukprot:TRINITY_DN42630_c0_g1_i1.p1 TRINITY_DN42630_c0_g1~~TRINITY_DN42630_c0_g1_i1.p1  ORF type:complete len:195 (+),score=26.12 TRINITY_DN42630_c0_g1_i1:30-587(+)